MLYCVSNFRHYGVGAAGITQTLAALSALPEDQLWFPAPPWRLTTVCNSSLEHLQALYTLTRVTGSPAEEKSWTRWIFPGVERDDEYCSPPTPPAPGRNTPTE